VLLIILGIGGGTLKIITALAIGLAGLFGCATPPPAYKFSGATPASADAKCQFAVVSTRPAGSCDELGILDWDSHQGGLTFGPMARDATEFKTAAAPFVCGTGGNVVSTEVNARGQYVRGTVFRCREAK
jgi:hypothetical protein